MAMSGHIHRFAVRKLDSSLLTVCEYRNEARFYAGLYRFLEVTITSSVCYAKSRPAFEVKQIGYPLPEMPLAAGNMAMAAIAEEFVNAQMHGKRGDVDPDSLPA